MQNAEAEAYWVKARQSLEGAENEYLNRRFDNCANRCYYACFQAVVSALIRAGIHTPSKAGRWDHEFVQAEFAGTLIRRRKLYSGELRETLLRTLLLRRGADYAPDLVSETEAYRALRRTRSLLEALSPHEGPAA